MSISKMNARTTCLLAGSAVLLLASHAEAYRPFNGTDADVAEFGEFELELGPLHYLQEGKNKYLLAPTTVLNLGIIPRCEVVADLTDTIPIHPRGKAALTDTDVFLKALIRRGVLQEETGPSIAVELGPLLPEVNGRTGFGASLDLIISEQWDWLALHLNNEPSLSRKDFRLSWFTSLIAEGRFGGPVRPVLELFWEREFSTKISEYSALGGVIWSPYESLDLDAALRVASAEKEPAFEARLGLTWAFPVWASGAPPEDTKSKE